MEWLTNLINAAGLSGGGGGSTAAAPMMTPREMYGGSPGGAAGMPVQPTALDQVAAGATPGGNPQQPGGLPGMLGGSLGAFRANPMQRQALLNQAGNLLKQPAIQPVQWMPGIPTGRV